MDLKVALKRSLALCVTTTILSTTMVLAKGRTAPVPSPKIPAALSPESGRASDMKAEKKTGPVAVPGVNTANLKSPRESKAEIKKALANRAVAAKVRAVLGNVNYGLLRKALDEPKVPGAETQVTSGFACWYNCLRANGVSVYSATVCAATCATGILPACIICAAISGGIATLCAIACAHASIGQGGGSDKGEILN